MMDERKITGRTVLIGMVLFFGVIFAVNGTFLYLAIDTWPGLSSKQPYRQGLDHNNILAGADAQKKLGWRSVVSGDASQLDITMTDKAGQPIPELVMKVIISRPVGSEEQYTMALTEKQDGSYHTPLSLPLPGRWIVDIRASHQNGPSYRLSHELIIKP